MTMSAVLDTQGHHGEMSITYENIALLELLSFAKRVKISVYITTIYYL